MSSRKRARVKLAEVAEAAGVSKMTASRVLNNGKGFSEETRDRVMAEVHRLGYMHDRMAVAFSSHSSSTFVGVSIPDLGNEVFAQVLEGIERRLNSSGYQAVLCVSQYDTASVDSWIERVLQWRPAGLIVTGRNHSEQGRKLLRQADVPVVELWDLNTSPLDLSVGINHYDSGYAMGRFMVERGHRTMAYIGTHHDTAHSAKSRFQGWQSAIQDGGGTVEDTYVLKDTPGFYGGYYATEQMLSRTADLDAIYYQNDNMAAGGLMFAQSRGLSVPGDLGIAGWGDLPISAILPQRLTTMHVAHLKLGQKAADSILAAIKGKPVEEVTSIDFRFVPGETI
ncbi:LacI family transcriptional regulator [Roseobacter cerasinus]|uniref:LacI family transcriptional regulator n=1 Tax=Roseobacter cerasinus TaxID=2602289 RepID=A0A640VYC1_9RHOB|nr:LacI family DNA-binding transcriptional regulator [Roseobacter cerasinus]GFE52380.1 LacI family transcriptional regulator [Roseobacter cerasinus]